MQDLSSRNQSLLQLKRDGGESVAVNKVPSESDMTQRGRDRMWWVRQSPNEHTECICLTSSKFELKVAGVARWSSALNNGAFRDFGLVVRTIRCSSRAILLPRPWKGLWVLAPRLEVIETGRLKPFLDVQVQFTISPTSSNLLLLLNNN